jgi:predicted RND superfamily exporter protein
MLRWGIRVASVSAEWPRTALAVMVVAVLAMAPGLFRLELQTDGHSLVPPGDPAIRADLEARRVFGLRDPLLVVIETRHPDGIYNAGTLERLQRMSRDLAALPGVGTANVQSLATEKSPSFYPNSFEFRPILWPPPRTPQRLAEVRRDVAAVDLFRGTLVSYDQRATAILVGVPGADGAGAGAPKIDRAALYHRVAAAVRPYETAADRISVVGAPAAEALLGEHVLADLAILVPLALAVIATLLWAACGGARAVLIGLAKVGAVQVFTLGLIGWSGMPVYLTTAVIPVLLTTVGLSDEIHLLWRYRHRPADQPPAEALRRTFEELARPIILTSLTTAIGFLSFLTSPVRPVWSFGLFTGVGALFCLAWALVATPALLALRPEAIRAVGEAGPALRLSRPAVALAVRPRLVLPVLALATAVLALGIPRLVVQDGWIDNFARQSPLRRAMERVDRRFAGTHVLLAVVTFDTPPGEVPVIPAARGPLLAGSAVAAIGRFEQGLRGQPKVGAVLGLASHLSTTAYLWGGQHEGDREIVDNPSWIYLHARRIGNVRGEARRRELVDDGFRRTVVTLLLKGANFRDTAALMAVARRLERTELAPVHARLDFAGDVAVSQAMIPSIVRTQLGSLLLALAGTLAIIAVLFRSLRLGLACVVPTALAVAWTFGLMGWLGISLGVATSIFCAVTLGIGADYGIHFLEQYQRARAAGAPRPDLVAAAEAGPAILVDALAIALGFGLLAVSRVPANSRLGLLVAVGLSSACLLTLGGEGRLLAWLGRRQPRLRSVPSSRHLEPGGEPALAEEIR